MRMFRPALGLLFLAVCSSLTAPASAAAVRVNFVTAEAAGTIVINTGERRLYLVLGGGQALRYPVGVGRTGRQWDGVSSIAEKYLEPNWVPPAAIREDRPNLPAVIPGGSAANPMGAAAMTLAGVPYAIHGVTRTVREDRQA